ncbi:MAG: RNA 2',3'-cyclic phosphodiesterase [Chloroflexota bacterium]
MNLLRAFIAIEIPSPIQQAIEKNTARLRSALDSNLVRWTPTSNIHLTLKFLGDVSPTTIEMLTQLLTVEASQYTCFEMQFGGLGTFPSPRRPRVIWIGIQAPAALEALQHGIEAATARMGYPTENRPFSPHLTIGRVKQTTGPADAQKIRVALEGTNIGALGNGKVEAVHLFKSDLKPTGSVYTRLFSAPLKNYEVTPERT